MKGLKKLTAVLSAGVLTFCGASLAVSAENVNVGMEVKKRGAEPVYALGTDLSLYPKGDADLDGEVTVYDSYLILVHFNHYTVGGLPGILTPDQIKVADVDGKSVWNMDTQEWDPLSALDSSLVLRYATLQIAGINVTMEDVIAGRFDRGALR